MNPVQPTLSITADDVTYDVAEMNESIRQMVTFMDDWRQKEADLSSELLMIRSAIRDVQNALLGNIRQEVALKNQAPDNDGLNAKKDTSPEAQ